MGAEHDPSLELDSLPSDPLVLFRRWYDAAESAGIRLPNAMALATADADGRPSIRHVLLRGFDEGGFVFYTNYGSRKALELTANPRAALSIYWRELDRQVNATGEVRRVADEESDAYFATRPRDARVGAWASKQSTALASREELMARVEEFEGRFEGVEVPRPPFWGGFRIQADAVEFWQGRLHRLHDRFRYERDGESWTVQRLSP